MSCGNQMVQSGGRRKRTARRTKKNRTKKNITSEVMETKGRETKGRKTKGRRGMNKYMIEKEKARKAGADSFMYNGTKYKKAMTKTGMVIYKKA